MASLDQFPIAQKWPATNPDAIQLYSIPTPNGVKVSIMLEELGLPYEAHRIAWGEEGVKHPDFLSLNPNGKIPAMIDPNGPDGKPIGIWESGAMLLYLAEKTGKFLPENPHERYETIQWVFFQMGGVGPMFGQYNFFHRFGGKDMEDPLPRDRYREESKRLFGVMDEFLADKTYFVAETYTIADMAIFGWVRSFANDADTRSNVEFDSFKNVKRWFENIDQREAVQRGLTVPPGP